MRCHLDQNTEKGHAISLLLFFPYVFFVLTQLICGLFQFQNLDLFGKFWAKPKKAYGGVSGRREWSR